MKTKLFTIFFFICLAVLFLFAFEKGLEKQEKYECLKWQEEAEQYKDYYLLDWQKEQCDYYNIEVIRDESFRS